MDIESYVASIAKHDKYHAGLSESGEKFVGRKPVMTDKSRRPS